MVDEGTPTDRPQKDAEYEWLGFFSGVHFHPPIKLIAKDAHQLAATLNEYSEIDYVNLESDSWTLVSHRHNFQVTVTQDKLELQSNKPAEILERYEVYYPRVLQCFEKHFSPQIILNSKAMIAGLLAIDGDARTFLSEHVFRVSQTRLNPLERPIHLLGMRIFFPAYQIEDDKAEGSDWNADVRLESSMADPRQLYVRTEATWDEPSPWNNESLEKVFGRLGTVSEYVRTRLNEFLRYENDSE